MKCYNDRKICFIICSNNQQYLEECLFYLDLLIVPDGYEVDIIVIEDAKSMVSGYNEGMSASDAKYKIYIHQDTFITDERVLHKIIDLFHLDTKIGIIGLTGCELLSQDGMIIHSERCGANLQFNRNDSACIEKVQSKYRKVEAVDGVFIATQYDIPWREDILNGWEFYDVSQCLEFHRAGYQVIVPAQDTPWAMHAYGMMKRTFIAKEREALLREYGHEIIKDIKKRRILFVHSKIIVLAGLMDGLLKLGHDVTEFEHKVDISVCDPRDVILVAEELEYGNYDLVVTYDFSEAVSQACQMIDVKYYAWVYDSPLMVLYTEAARNINNYISVFDRKQFARLQENRIPHLKYFPLATEVGLFGAANITKDDEHKYNAEVAFVGSLYDKRGFEEIFANATTELENEAWDIINAGSCEWDGEKGIFNKASTSLIEYMISQEDERYFEKFNVDKRYFCESLRLVRKRNERERIKILNEIAKRFQLTLYTTNPEQKELVNVKIRSKVNYLSEMPKVFHLSKINLNITSRSIESGIPQRVWDIMAVGGFCLTNYQPEIEEYFEIGKDLDVYHNLAELMEKIEYYLNHEEIRFRIALNGYRKVKKYHSYEKRLEDILRWIELE